MSEVMLTILDAERAIHETQHGSVADALVAALAAEPETIDELEAAVARFQKPNPDHRLFASFGKGSSEESWDAGIVLIDLAARMVATESSYSTPGRQDYVRYHNGQFATDVAVHYQLSDDWLIVRSLEQWRAQANERRAARAAQPPLDARAVLFGKPLSEFIARECWQARATQLEDPIGEIHARWLTTPRDDLRGQTPRALLLAKRAFIENDVNWRAHQWSFLGQCPEGLELDSAAYRLAGFGTHENVIYYDLMRHLLNFAWERAQTATSWPMEAEIEQLERLKNDWLYTPQFDVGLSPITVIERERQRLPVTMDGGCAVIDEDCPMCQAMTDLDFGPMFWHLDGSSMDEGFVFSFHRTRAEYEAEQREWEEMSAKFERERKERIARGEPEFPGYVRRNGCIIDEEFAQEFLDDEPDKPEYLC